MLALRGVNRLGTPDARRVLAPPALALLAGVGGAVIVERAVDALDLQLDWTFEGRYELADATRALLETLGAEADGSGAEEVLWTSDYHMHVESWTPPNGQALLFTEIHPQTREDLWVLRLEGDSVAQPLIQTAFREFGGRVSPDGRWLAYVSDESGRFEVYVQAYPNLGRKVPVSTGGGTQPVWGKSGRTLYYRGEDAVIEVTVTPGDQFGVTSTAPLFMDRYVRDGNHTGYDVAGDGEAFLMIENEDAENPWTSLNVVLNWFEDVKRRVPTGR